jgi:hypothetical protein
MASDVTARKIRLLVSPSKLSDLWREGLAQACIEKGWCYVEYWGGDEPALNDACETLVVGWDFSGFEGVQFDWVVLQCPVRDAIDELAARLDLSPVDAVRHASSRFANASYLAGVGAPVFSSEAEAFNFPGLGPVRRRGGPARPTSGQPSLLDMYRTLPVPAGSQVRWTPDMFSFPGSTPIGDQPGHIDLFGRRRMLFNGPNLALPPGLWRIEARFMVEPRNRVNLLFEWGFGVAVAAVDITFDKPGHYELALEHEWTGPAPADFRASLMVPVLEGEFSLDECIITLLDSDRVPQG